MEPRENITAGILGFDQEATEAAIRMELLSQEGHLEPENGLIGEIIEGKDAYNESVSRKDTKYFKDALGSTILLLDPNGQIKEKYSYSPFGSIDYQNGTSDNTKQFTGKEIDEESGLSYFGARYYNPEIGRWISRDPVPGFITKPASLNSYSYCFNNPLNYIDPDGRTAYVQDGKFVDFVADKKDDIISRSVDSKGTVKEEFVGLLADYGEFKKNGIIEKTQRFFLIKTIILLAPERA